MFNKKYAKVMKKSSIKKVNVSYRGFKNLNASFKSIKAARLYCDSIYEQFGFDMIMYESFVVIR